MRHSNVGPSAHKGLATPPASNSKPAATSPAAPASNAAPSNAATSHAAPAHAAPASHSAHGVVRVFGTDHDEHPMASFESGSSIAHVLQALHLQNGGLKIKGGADTFVAELHAGDYSVLGSVGLRLMVSWKGNKVVVPYAYGGHQVSNLLEEIASRFSRFNTEPKELKMAELRTIDGYSISKYDRIMEVIHNNDALEAIDFDTWLKQQAELCKDNWLYVRQSDFVDDSIKWAIVGKHTHGKLFVQTGNGKKVDRLELFELEDLKVFAKEGQHQILHSKGKVENFEWFANASFNVTASGQVTAVTLEVKSSSDVRPVIKKIDISIENGQLVKGEVKTIQTSEEPEDAGSSKPLPPAKRTEVPLVDPTPPPTDLPLASVQAESKLKIEQVEPVVPDQAWANSDGFMNNFYLNFSFTNPTDNPITIAKVKTEYQNAAGEWVAAKNTAIGHKAGYYDYRWNWNSQNFGIDPHGVEKVAILCGVGPIKAPQVDRQRRAHGSLPNPLKIRVTFEDDQGATCQIEVVNYNKPHDQPTKESTEKYNSKQYDFWTQLDDAASESRHYVAICKVKETENKEYYEIKSSLSSGSVYYFYKSQFQRLAFEAIKKGTDEVEIDSLTVADSKGSSAHAFALVDRAKRRVYAIKFVIKAHDASLEDYFSVKPLLADD